MDKIKLSDCKVEALITEHVGAVSVVSAQIGDDDVTLYEKVDICSCWNEDYIFTDVEKCAIKSAVDLLDGVVK